jgi:hypothetical protein
MSGFLRSWSSPFQRFISFVTLYMVKARTKAHFTPSPSTYSLLRKLEPHKIYPTCRVARRDRNYHVEGLAGISGIRRLQETNDFGK